VSGDETRLQDQKFYVNPNYKYKKNHDLIFKIVINSKISAFLP